jgi:predicted GIY-YIG superfamily endonuclease
MNVATPRAPAPAGRVYLLHFTRPIHHARHYLGFAARDLDRRLADHAIGRGARLTREAIARGIGWECVWSAPGERADERALKLSHGYWSHRLCPICYPALLARRRAAARRRRARRCA